MCRPVLWGETDGVSGAASRGQNGDLDDADEGKVAMAALFSTASGQIIWASAPDEVQNWQKAFGIDRFQQKVDNWGDTGFLF